MSDRAQPVLVFFCSVQSGPARRMESLLAHVELDRPELPWLFSPYAAVGDRIRPWLVLVVCDATISTEEPGCGA